MMKNIFTLRLKHRLFICILLGGLINNLPAQGVSVREDQQPAHPSAILDIQSGSKGFLLPRMSTVQRTTITSPSTGLLTYDGTAKGLFLYNGIQWRDIRVGTADSIWTQSGANMYYTGGHVGIGTNTPLSQLHVKTSTNTQANVRLYNRNTNGGFAGVLFNTPLSNWRMEVTSGNLFQIVHLPSGNAVMTMNTSGNFGIGTQPGNDRLTVNGNVRSEQRITGNSIVGTGDLTAREGYFGNRLTLTAPNGSTGGRLRVYGTSGARIVNFSFLTGHPNNGFLQVFHNNESKTQNFLVDSDGLGKMFTEYIYSKLMEAPAQSSSAGAKTDMYGGNGSLNVKVSFLNGHPDRGFLGVYDASGNQQASMYVNGNGDGVISGDVKNFYVPHPNDASKDIWYASLEGPELAAYCRGTGHLADGEAWISFPEHFEAVINHTTMSVIVSPTSLSSKGLAVVEKSASGFRVKELSSGTGSYAFDWEVTGVRKGKEEFEVIRFKRDGPEGS